MFVLLLSISFLFYVSGLPYILSCLFSPSRCVRYWLWDVCLETRIRGRGKGGEVRWLVGRGIVYGGRRETQRKGGGGYRRVGHGGYGLSAFLLLSVRLLRYTLRPGKGWAGVRGSFYSVLIILGIQTIEYEIPFRPQSPHPLLPYSLSVLLRGPPCLTNSLGNFTEGNKRVVGMRYCVSGLDLWVAPLKRVTHGSGISYPVVTK